MSETKDTSGQGVEFKMDIKNGVEFRYDPLIKSHTRINPARATRPMSSVSTGSLDQLVADSKEKDPFSPYEKMISLVPKVPEEVLARITPESGVQAKDGLMQLNEAILFPNKFPFGQNHGVATTSASHYVALADFTTQQVADCFTVCLEYIKATAQDFESGEAAWPSLVWNYMPPSAGSIIHPHMQVFCEDTPTPRVVQMLEAASNFFTNSSDKKNYYQSLVEEEARLGQRYIGEIDGVHAIAPFAPQGANEVQLVIPDQSSITQLTPQQIQALSKAMVTVLKAYASIGVGSFNMACFTSSVAPRATHAQSFGLTFAFWSRPFPSGVYTNDTGPIELRYDISVINTVPEQYSQWVKKVWDEEMQK